MKFLFILLIILLSFLLLCAVGITALRAYGIFRHIRKKHKKGSRKKLRIDIPIIIMLAICLIIFTLLMLCIGGLKGVNRPVEDNDIVYGPVFDAEAAANEKRTFRPKATSNTDPSNWGIDWEIMVNGSIVDTYKRDKKISFGKPEEYFALFGVSAFRGDNYRTGATYGTADITARDITDIWSIETGSLAGVEGNTWTGSGWTGQPLVVKWDAETLAHMNVYSSVSDGLVEVIYATLDGHIYFLDLKTGVYTRDPIDVGMAFKGSGTIDPRGYPLLYVGSGDETADGERPRMFVISLIDGTILYEYGNEDEFAIRKDNNEWCAFDSSPVLDAETDTLIWPGENGVLYTIKLNTKYDKAAGTISVNPDEAVKTRYAAARSGEDEYWLGYECSVNVIDHYAYLSENGGLFYCVDLNTMELVWVQDTKDDSNSTPVAEFDENKGVGYIYTAPSLHWTADNNNHGEISIYKLNALDGSIVWERSYECNTVSGVSGGVQASPLLGKKGTSLEGLIIYPIARTPDRNNGILVALNTDTGEEVWRLSMNNYAWSSPVAVYSTDGTGYIIQCDSSGNVFLLNGASGEVIEIESVGALVEASPVVYENTIVVGTRGRRIYGLQVK